MISLKAALGSKAVRKHNVYHRDDRDPSANVCLSAFRNPWRTSGQSSLLLDGMRGFGYLR